MAWFISLRCQINMGCKIVLNGFISVRCQINVLQYVEKEKDILCDDGLGHCLESGLLQICKNISTISRPTDHGSKFQLLSLINTEIPNSPSAEEDFAPAKISTNIQQRLFFKSRQVNDPIIAIGRCFLLIENMDLISSSFIYKHQDFKIACFT